MSLFIKILIYFVFLIAFIAWIVAAYYIFKKFSKDLLCGKSFLSTELMLFNGFLGFFGFIWLLSGFLSIKLIILFVLISHIGFIITGILWRIIGTTDIPWAASVTWTASEIPLKHPLAFIVTLILCPLLMLAYVIVIGIIYFGNPIHSPRATILIFRYTLIVMYGSEVITLLPGLVSLISSKNLDEGTRLRIIINRGGGMIFYALVIALMFWSFGITGKGYKWDVSGISLLISPVLILVIFSYFVCTIIIPYFIGTQQAKNWRINLIEKKKDWHDKLLEVLEFPTSSQYIPKLEELQNALVSDEMELIEKDAMVEKGTIIDTMESTESLSWHEKNLIEAYKESREFEPRFCYLDFLRHLKSKIEEIKAELEKQNIEEEKVKIADAFAQPYRSKKDDLDKTIESERKTKPIINTAIVGMALAIIVPILTELAKWIWLTFEKTMK